MHASHAHTWVRVTLVVVLSAFAFVLMQMALNHIHRPDVGSKYARSQSLYCSVTRSKLGDKSRFLDAHGRGAAVRHTRPPPRLHAGQGGSYITQNEDAP